MSKFEEIISDQKPDPIEYPEKCLGCPRVQQAIEDIKALREIQQENLAIASLAMDESERDKLSRELAATFASSQGIPEDDLEELVESIKQDYPKMLDMMLSCFSDEERATRNGLKENTSRCQGGTHRLIAFDVDGNISASGDLCGLDIPKKSERVVPAIIYPEVQIDKN